MKPFSFLCSLLLPLTVLAPQKMQAVEENPLSQDINNFAFSLYNTLYADPSQNALFSPYSVFSCLSLVYLGAKEETAAQMAKALQLSVDIEDLPATAANLSDFLRPKGQNPSYELNIANALWLNQDSALVPDYQDMAQNNYGAKVESVNFNDEPAAVSAINGWTSEQTRGKIQDLLSTNDISRLTKLIVTNALYFKGTWDKAFDPEWTQPAPFYAADNTSVSISMMEQLNSFPYYEDDQMQLLALPYAGTDDQEAEMACVFFLPKAGKLLSSLEPTLTDATFREWMNRLSTQRVNVKIPLFTLKLKEDLNDILQQMGMQLPFTHKANFTGIIQDMKDLSLDKVMHEAFFSIDEQGVTAAAATAAIMGLTCVGPSSTLHHTFTADHPFLFAIVELKTKTLLFLGKFTAPN